MSPDIFQLPRTSKKHGNRQAESGSQASHRGSLTENAENGESDTGGNNLLKSVEHTP